MTESCTPAVTVVVCTYNRPESLPAALASVVGQDFVDFEVIVVDDGSEPPVSPEISLDRRVRVVRVPHQGVGAARARALAEARGEFIAYCDDDDEWKPQHLSTLVTFLQGRPEVDLVYGDSAWERDGGEEAVAWSVDHDVFHLMWDNYIFATDVVHRAAAAREAGGFDPKLPCYEDWDLWLRMSQRYVLRHLPAVLSYHRWHADALCAAPDWTWWDRVRRRYVRRTQREGVAPGHWRRARSDGRAPFDPSTWSDGRRELLWRCSMRRDISFGRVARELLVATEARGIDVAMAPFGDQPVAGFERFYKQVGRLDRLAFYYDPVFQPTALECERIVVYTMWETTAVPTERIDEINRAARLLFVPCSQNVTTFRECGVTVPIAVLHHGVSTDRFPSLQRPRRDWFTFGTFGELSARKGIDVLVRAFTDEFRPHEPVRLLLKTGAIQAEVGTTDPRVVMLPGLVDQAGLLEILRQMDAFVLPSRGEGFGLCGLEAMSTGLPVIATNWSGPADYLDLRDSLPLRWRLASAAGTEAHGVRFEGHWAEPDYEHLRYLLRWLFDHPMEARAMGEAASQRVRREWTWARSAEQLCRELDLLAQSRD